MKNRVMDTEHDTKDTDLAAVNEAAQRPLGPGERLKAARLEKGLELSFIAAETRIPSHHLEALEEEAFEELPARTYALGFARNYARAVGLDETEIADAVRAEMADESERRAAVVGTMQPGDPTKLPSAGLAWFGAFAAILLAVGVYAFYNTYFSSGSGLESLLADNESEDEAENLADADGGGPQAPEISADGQVVFTALDDEIWVRFFVDGGDVLLEKTMKKGDTFSVPKNVENVRLNTGRPQFLDITIDGQSVPKLAEEQVTLVEPVTASALIARFAPEPAPAGDGTASSTTAPNTRAVSRPRATPSPQTTTATAAASETLPAALNSPAATSPPLQADPGLPGASQPANTPAAAPASAPAPAASNPPATPEPAPAASETEPPQAN